MKEKLNQLFKDKLFLVMLVLGLLTIVAAAGVVTIQRGNAPEENPYMQMQEPGALIAEDKKNEELLPIAGSSNARRQEPETAPAGQRAQQTETKVAKADSKKETAADTQAAQAGAGQGAAIPLVLDFADTSKIGWPVMGNILLDYSMDTTIYFPTLAQYQCNPGVVIQAEVSQPVQTPANARVEAIGVNEEIGNFVVLDFGNDYLATCGQLKEIQVVENEYLEAGRILGYVAEPTKYYSVEGSNVYFEIKHGGEPVDPVGYFE